MAWFDWQRKPSASFGEVWVPVAVVQLQTTRGTFSSVLPFVDSGSVISLLRRSVADELGLQIDSGRQIALHNVAGSQTEAYVHELTLRFAANERTIRAPFAIATRETVPNLLGRLGVFEQFELWFDPRKHRTYINPV